MIITDKKIKNFCLAVVFATVIGLELVILKDIITAIQQVDALIALIGG